MAASPFITHLRELHKKAKAGALDARDRAQYEQSRRELMRVAFTAQAATFPGKPQREVTRIALVLKVEITFSGSAPQSLTTVDVSAQGFSALLAFGAGVGAAAQFTMRVPGGDGPIVGKCKVVGHVKQGGLQRFSFAFDGLDAGARDRLEETLFDFLIQRLP